MTIPNQILSCQFLGWFVTAVNQTFRGKKEGGTSGSQNNTRVGIFCRSPPNARESNTRFAAVKTTAPASIASCVT